MSTQATLTLPAGFEAGQISDGYHTFDELYEHRHALFIALCREMPDLAWRAKEHHDGTGIGGWFIAGLDLPSGTITYHLPLIHWVRLDGYCKTLERGKPWDGHTSSDVVQRLLAHKPEAEQTTCFFLTALLQSSRYASILMKEPAIEANLQGMLDTIDSYFKNEGRTIVAYAGRGSILDRYLFRMISNARIKPVHLQDPFYSVEEGIPVLVFPKADGRIVGFTGYSDLRQRLRETTIHPFLIWVGRILHEQKQDVKPHCQWILNIEY